MALTSNRWLLATCVATSSLWGCATTDPETGTDSSVSYGQPNGYDSGTLPADGAVSPLFSYDSGGFPPVNTLVDSGAGVGKTDGGGGGDGGVVVDPTLPPLPPGKDYSGWTWVEPKGALCRDGSPAGYYYRRGKSKELLIYLNGGGACADPYFCGLNPANVNQDLPIELLLGGALNLLSGPNAVRQEPPKEGIFLPKAENPVADWNMVYVPYCTGDIHAGSNRDVVVKDVPGKQQFVGFDNFGLFLDSFGPSFQKAGTVLLTGSSAGGFGTLFNYDRTQTFFDKTGVKVMAISDSGIPMRTKYMAMCLQKRWRDYWGFNNVLPKDCADCLNPAKDITESFGNYLFNGKYGKRMLGGFISTKEDQIIRAFYTAGQSETAGQPDDCTKGAWLNTFVGSLGLGSYPGPMYTEGLKDVINGVVGVDKIGYYVFAGENHMHLQRARYYEKNGNTMSIAEWVKDILAEKPTKQGTL